MHDSAEASFWRNMTDLTFTSTKKQKDHSALQQAQKELLEQSGLGGVLLVASAVVVYFIEPLIRDYPVTFSIFLALLSAFTLVRLYLYRVLLASTDSTLPGIYYASLLGNALTWGTYAAWVMTLPDGVNGGSAIVLAVTSAAASTGVITMSMNGRLSKLLVLSYFAPMFVYQLLHLNNPQVLAVGALTLLYAGFLFHLAYRQNRSYWQTLYANQTLRLQARALEEARNLAVNSNKALEVARVQAVAASNEAMAANNAKTEFLMHMSHEIRTPLNGVIGMADLLATTALDEKQGEQVNTILQSGKLVLGLINDILDFSQINAGKVELNVTDVDVIELANTCISIVAPLLRQRGNKLVLVEQLGSGVRARVDRLRLQQVLTNLLSNANKFTDQGEIVMRLEMQTRTEDLKILRLEVQDSGRGIAELQQAQIFEAFVKGHKGEPDEGGTGLGLAICKRLVQLMGGNIGVHSASGHGACFWVEIPYVAGAAPPPPVTMEPGENDASAVADSQSQRAAILVVEDNLINQKVIAAFLNKLKHPHHIVATGRAALETYEKDRPGLILMDCNLPDVSGMEVTRMIREAEKEYALPRSVIIAITAHAFANVIEECLESGMDDHLAKPVTIKALQAMLEKWS
jgi:signal transduction histidine kinase/ActR/RegA family two-component response regulator